MKSVCCLISIGIIKNTSLFVLFAPSLIVSPSKQVASKEDEDEFEERMLREKVGEDDETPRDYIVTLMSSHISPILFTTIFQLVSSDPQRCVWNNGIECGDAIRIDSADEEERTSTTVKLCLLSSLVLSIKLLRALQRNEHVIVF